MNALWLNRWIINVQMYDKWKLKIWKNERICTSIANQYFDLHTWGHHIGGAWGTRFGMEMTISGGCLGTPSWGFALVLLSPHSQRLSSTQAQHSSEPTYERIKSPNSRRLICFIYTYICIYVYIYMYVHEYILYE